MRTIFLCYFLIFNCFLFAENPSSDPLEKWIQATSFMGNKQYTEAIDSYTQALSSFDGVLDKDHFYVLVDRGHAYFELESYQLAIEDFSAVIESDLTLPIDKIRAAKGRLKCFAELNLYENFKNDYVYICENDPSYPVVEMNDKFVVIRNLSNFTEQIRTFFCDCLVSFGICKQEDIIFYDSGICIIKRSDPQEEEEFGIHVHQAHLEHEFDLKVVDETHGFIHHQIQLIYSLLHDLYFKFYQLLKEVF
ncbi:tetratricopeptide repeat protein [Parachlamydia sp.]|uniref:tetratricopeptide repeat protein n=1 Tax=Parachlamydia sp. TaxID=2052048 RepID=UPI003D0B4FC9